MADFNDNDSDSVEFLPISEYSLSNAEVVSNHPLNVQVSPTPVYETTTTTTHRIYAQQPHLTSQGYPNLVISPSPAIPPTSLSPQTPPSQRTRTLSSPPPIHRPIYCGGKVCKENIIDVVRSMVHSPSLCKNRNQFVTASMHVFGMKSAELSIDKLNTLESQLQVFFSNKDLCEYMDRYEQHKNEQSSQYNVTLKPLAELESNGDLTSECDSDSITTQGMELESDVGGTEMEALIDDVTLTQGPNKSKSNEDIETGGEESDSESESESDEVDLNGKNFNPQLKINTKSEDFTNFGKTLQTLVKTFRTILNLNIAFGEWGSYVTEQLHEKWTEKAENELLNKHIVNMGRVLRNERDLYENNLFKEQVEKDDWKLQASLLEEHLAECVDIIESFKLGSLLSVKRDNLGETNSKSSKTSSSTSNVKPDPLDMCISEQIENDEADKCLRSNYRRDKIITRSQGKNTCCEKSGEAERATKKPKYDSVTHENGKTGNVYHVEYNCNSIQNIDFNYIKTLGENIPRITINTDNLSLGYTFTVIPTIEADNRLSISNQIKSTTLAQNGALLYQARNLKRQFFELESESCGICYDDFTQCKSRNKVYLLCGHSICYKCVRSIKEIHGQESLCPFCKTLISTGSAPVTPIVAHPVNTSNGIMFTFASAQPLTSQSSEHVSQTPENAHSIDDAETEVEEMITYSEPHY